MSYDRRTGRPIARSVVRSNSENVSFEMLSEERYTGSIVQEAKPTKNKNVSYDGYSQFVSRQLLVSFSGVRVLDCTWSLDWIPVHHKVNFRISFRIHLFKTFCT